jgi:hypothetical protein
MWGSKTKEKWRDFHLHLTVESTEFICQSICTEYKLEFINNSLINSWEQLNFRKTLIPW